MITQTIFLAIATLLSGTTNHCVAFSPALQFKPKLPLSPRLIKKIQTGTRSKAIPLFSSPLFSVPIAKDDIEDDDDSLSIEPKMKEIRESSSVISRIKNFFTPKSADGLTTKQRLAKMGFSCLLSYGFVSNMSAMLFLSLAWFSFSKKTGLSPLAPGQWKSFMVVYSGFYVLSNFVRPVRVAIAVTIGKYFDSFIEFVQKKTNLSRSKAIALLVFLANFCGTMLAMVSGITLASILSGVPIFVVKK